MAVVGGFDELDGLLCHTSKFRFLHGRLRHFVVVVDFSLSKELVFEALGDGINVVGVSGLKL